MRHLCVLLLMLLPVSQVSAQHHVELILDASGSMYNKLEDGRYRISAAKEVLEAFVNALPVEDLNVGLRIYGSQRAPDDPASCRDSKLVVPVSGVHRDRLLAAIRSTRARGSTPIAYSLEQAAADFPDGAESCLIVLVTDGEEVCGGDLEASAAKLRERGCEVDLRIIGFDLTPEAIASFSGVGTFENATDATALAAALERAVEGIVEREPLGEATLSASPEVAAGAPFEVSWRADEGPRDYVTIVEVGAADGEYASYAYTSSGSPVTLHAPITSGDYELRYQSDRVAGVSGRRVIRVTPSEIALEALQEIPAGQPFEVKWIGPDGERDYVTIVGAEAADGKYGSYLYTRDGSPIRLHAPIRAGAYELRYQSDRTSGVFARRPIAVTPAEIRLEAPARVMAGTRFDVQWKGPDGDKDYLTIVSADAAEGQFTNYAYTRSGPTVTLNAPVDAGAFEVRYQSDREKGVFARLPITLTPMKVRLEAPDVVSAGASFDVRWEGPDGSRDYVTIVLADAEPGAYLDYAYTRQGSTLALKAPDEPGSYELRYQSDRVTKKVFGRRPLRVE